MIHSPNVINGGASRAEVERLWRKERGLDGEDGGRSRSRNPSMRRTNSQRPEMVQRQTSNTTRPAAYRTTSNQPSMGRQPSYKDDYGLDVGQKYGSQIGRSNTNRSRVSSQGGRPAAIRTRTEEHMARDGYGPPQRMVSSRQANGYSPISPQGARPSRFREL